MTARPPPPPVATTDPDISDGADGFELGDVLDLHQFRPADVPELVPDYLEEAVGRGFAQVRIVHGKGRGTLRRIVHAALERSALVESFVLAEPFAGGWGATIVVLRRAVPGTGGDHGQ